MPADTDKEVFEVVDEENRVIGRKSRGECHSEGHLHRSVYCLVFNTERQLLLQQRSSRKKIGPGEWDLSVAEHLQPGETYADAAVRGLHEELGVKVSVADIRGPLAPHHMQILDIPGKIKDHEFVECFRLDDWNGDLEVDQEEVQAVRWVAVEEVYQQVQQGPQRFTPWFRGELAMLENQIRVEGRRSD